MLHFLVNSIQRTFNGEENLSHREIKCDISKWYSPMTVQKYICMYNRQGLIKYIHLYRLKMGLKKKEQKQNNEEKIRRISLMDFKCTLVKSIVLANLRLRQVTAALSNFIQPLYFILYTLYS